MRNLILSALLLASAFETAFGEQDGDWFYSVENNQATITGYSGARGAVTIPSSVNGIPVVYVGAGQALFGYGNSLLVSVTFPNTVKNVSGLQTCHNLTSVTFNGSTESFDPGSFNNCHSVFEISIPQASVNDLLRLGFSEKVAYATKAKFQGSLNAIDLANNEAFITAMAQFLTALATNDGFVTAVANKIKQTQGSYGIATQGAVSDAITSLATKTELTASLNQSRTDGINSVLSNPNLWTLYTTSQIQNMAVGDLVLNRQENGSFVLNYDIEQSADLQTWTTYQALSLPLTGLPTDKAFVRIKPKQ